MFNLQCYQYSQDFPVFCYVLYFEFMVAALTNGIFEWNQVVTTYIINTNRNNDLLCKIWLKTWLTSNLSHTSLILFLRFTIHPDVSQTFLVRVNHEKLFLHACILSPNFKDLFSKQFIWLLQSPFFQIPIVSQTLSLS